MMELTEGVGESSSPPRAFGAFGSYDIRSDICARLVENGNEEAITNPEFRQQLDAHFSRLPASYGVDVNMDRVEDVLLHQKILAEAKDPEKRPVFHVRFLESAMDEIDDVPESSRGCSSNECSSRACERNTPLNSKIMSQGGDCAIDFEPCARLEDLNLNVKKNVDKRRDLVERFHGRQDSAHVPVHEIIFSTIDKPKLLSQLSALLSDIGLNIREAHVFSTTDGYSLDVFVVDGWPVQDTDGLHNVLGTAIAQSETSWSDPSLSRKVGEKALAKQPKQGDFEIDKRLLKKGDKIASGSCGELYHGIYNGVEVALKILSSEHLNEASEVEFTQEVMILREVKHKNVVRFIGACTKLPEFCIVTEYMVGGSLYDFLHKNHNVLGLPLLLKFAIDICKGMAYLHQNNIIHRDLKTANLLMDPDNVVKVADFGVARFENQGGVMTAETGTYRWMAPEVINHQPYDHKADVFSFAIVLWELATAKIPYDHLSPLQAALGVRQGLRPELPNNIHPKLLDLMQRCWAAEPIARPSFKEITSELEELLQEVESTADA